jgi:hypothetical protein
VIRGHCAYYGITGNGRRVRWYHHQLLRIWKKWLARRGRTIILRRPIAATRYSDNLSI